MEPIVDEVFLESRNYDQAIVLSLTVVGIFLLKGIVTYLQTVILNRIGNSIVARFQRQTTESSANFKSAVGGIRHQPRRRQTDRADRTQ